MQLRLSVSVWVAAAALWASWLYLDPGAGWRLVVSATVLLGAGALAWRFLGSQASGELIWDGGFWHWHAVGLLDSEPVDRLTVVADLQSSLILRVRLASVSQAFVWAVSSDLPVRWLDFRRAVHGRIRIEADSSEAPPEDAVPSSDAGVSRKLPAAFS